MLENVERILISKEQIQQKVAELGSRISKDYKGKKLMLVSVLKGSVVFMADLMRAIDIPLKIDFMSISSYGNKTVSTGNIKILKDLDVNIEGYDIIVVEDIFDSGITLSHTIELLLSRKPNSIKVCTLLSKPERHQVDIKVDYQGFIVPDVFVVGYGLDFDEEYRNLPFVGVLKSECYK